MPWLELSSLTAERQACEYPRLIEKPAGFGGTTPDPLVGRRWGRYQIDALLGHGNRALVYRAREITTQQVVAIRVLDRDLATDTAFSARFHRAVAMAVAVWHPTSCRSSITASTTGTAYVVRPYVEGGTLRERLRGPLSLTEVLPLLGPIADALDHAHRHGLLHGDLKPGNILLPTPESRALTDLGTAQALPQRENNLVATACGAQFGTPEYVSPEQGLGRSPMGGPISMPWGSSSTRPSPVGSPSPPGK